MEVGEAQRLQSLGLGQRLSFAYFRSHTRMEECGKCFGSVPGRWLAFVTMPKRRSSPQFHLGR